MTPQPMLIEDTMHWLVTTLLGAWIGGTLWGIGGALGGGLLGLLLSRQLRAAASTEQLRQLELRVDALESELAQLRRIHAGAHPAGARDALPPVPSLEVETLAQATPPLPSPAAPPQPEEEPPPLTASNPAHTPGELDILYERAREWLVGGNTLVRIGLLVLFFGLAFLARYAVEAGLVPVELRLAGIAAGGIALLLGGWRLRDRRAGYALSLQGGGVAVLYLTVFAALRLYGLLPAGLAFALLHVYVNVNYDQP